ncbi:hypothetical protein Tco_1192905 [Tanacetum coccineum]
MANFSEDIQCVGSDTRPPMLDRTDFASWQQRIRLYCQGKENRVNILNSIDEGPFSDGTFVKHWLKGIEMLLEGSELTKEDRESQLFVRQHETEQRLGNTNDDQLYAYLKQHEAHANENKMLLERFT